MCERLKARVRDTETETETETEIQSHREMGMDTGRQGQSRRRLRSWILGFS